MPFAHVERDVPQPTPSELNRRRNDVGNLAAPENFKGKSPQRAAEAGIRLSPLPARNMLLTLLFFSALAAAILYWIFFPPAAPPPSESSSTSSAQPAATAPAREQVF